MPEALARPSSRGILVPIKRGFSGQLAMVQAPFMALAAASAACRTPMYVPQRQMLPSSPFLTSSRRRVGVLVEEGLAGGDEAGRAVAAHQAVVLVEGVGHALLAGVEALQGLDRLALARDGQRGAGVDRVAVDDRRAGAAARAIADPLGAGHVEPVAQRVEQRAPRLDRARAILAVDLERDLDRAGEHLGLAPGRPWPRRAPAAAWPVSTAVAAATPEPRKKSRRL